MAAKSHTHTLTDMPDISPRLRQASRMKANHQYNKTICTALSFCKGIVRHFEKERHFVILKKKGIAIDFQKESWRGVGREGAAPPSWRLEKTDDKKKIDTGRQRKTGLYRHFGT